MRAGEARRAQSYMRGGGPMTDSTRFVGLDVRKATDRGGTGEPDGTVNEHGPVANDPSSIRNLVRRLKQGAQKGRFQAGSAHLGLTRWCFER